jgi:hypothetical protein
MRKNAYLNRVCSVAIAGLMIAIFGFVAGCVTPASKEMIKTQESPNLKDITLSLTDLADKPAKLVNGSFKGDHLSILVLREAAADLNRDGLIDGAVIIFENSGGSGNFRNLCLMLNNGKELVHTDTVFIGDRVKITDLKIIDNAIMVDFLDRAPGEAMVTKPHIEKKVVYHIQGMKLEQVFTD